MNTIAEEILAKRKDLLLEKMQKLHDDLAEVARNWLKAREELTPVLKAFEALGAEITFQTDMLIHVHISGDKDCFISCWKLWRSIGCRLSSPPKGATELAQFVDSHNLKFFFYFTSTVCKRVKVGTKMQQVDVYETQCGATLEAPPELEGPSGTLVPVDDIPF